MDINTTDKVQIGDSTTGTSTSTTWHCPYTQPKAEQGWECPRCGRINAPWKSQCDCSGRYWTITNDSRWYAEPSKTGDNPEWWKDYVTCSQGDSVMNSSVTYKTDVPKTYTTMRG